VRELCGCHRLRFGYTAPGFRLALAGLGGHFARLPLRLAVAVARFGSGWGVMVVSSPGAARADMGLTSTRPAP